MQSFDLYLRFSGSFKPSRRVLLLALAGVVGAANFLLIAFPPWTRGNEGFALKCALFGNILCAMFIGGIVLLQYARKDAGRRNTAPRMKTGARDYGQDWAVHLQD